VLALLLALLRPAAAQSGWTRVAEDPRGIVFYAKAPRTSARDRVSLDLLYDYRDVQQDPDTLLSHRSAWVAVTVDCRNRALRMGDMRKFGENMARGPVVERTHASDVRYREARPDTMDDAIVRFACKRKD